MSWQRVVATVSAAALAAGCAAHAAEPQPAPVRNAPAVTLAFAGDSNADGVAGGAIKSGWGEAGAVLARADVAMVNIETAIADDASGLKRQPKQYTFVTSTAYLEMVKKQGVDVVTLANNHAMDYGTEGMRRTLQAKGKPLPFVGVGATADEAFAPWTTAVKGRRVVVYGVSDVLDPSLNWAATADKPGLAMIDSDAGLKRLLEAVRDARRDDPDAVIVIYLHWGSELVRCPKPRQQQLAEQLAKAGASVVVGSHAHVLLPVTQVGDTVVAYGLGNFNFAGVAVDRRTTGVLEVTVPGTGPGTTTWNPAMIKNGVPEAVTDPATRKAAVDAFGRLGAGC